MRCIILLLLVICFSKKVTAQWTTVGNAGFSTGTAFMPKLAVFNDIVYVAYEDWANNSRITVMKYDGGSWMPVGAPGAFNGSGHSIAVDNGMPYLVYSDNVTGLLSVMKFDGSNWRFVGNEGFSPVITSNPILAIENGTPYVAYTDGANGNKATVMKFDGSSWTTVGNAGFTVGAAVHFSLDVEGSIPYLAYADNINGNKATVMKFDGSGWTTVGNAGFSAGVLSYTSIAVVDGTPYVAYADGANGYKATVMKFDGSSWTTVGNAGFSAGTADFTMIGIANSLPYVAYADGANGYKATVMKFDGSSWTTVGNAGFTTSNVVRPVMYIDGSTPFIVYQDGALGGKATVMKYTERDVTSPVLSNFSFSISDKSIVVRWITNEPATSTVVCTDPEGKTLIEEENALVTDHRLSLTGLTPSTAYTLNIASRDQFANTGHYTSSVTTLEQSLITYYRDADGDGFGDPNSSQSSTSQPTGYVVNNKDCDDTKATIHPSATEVIGNEIDENCDGIIERYTSIAFTSNRDHVSSEVYIMRSNGTNIRRLTNNTAFEQEPRISPNGAKIAFVSDRDGNKEIYVMSADGSNPVRLTNNSVDDINPSWSPDGSKIAFTSKRDGNYEIYIMNADGSNQIRLTSNSISDYSPTWSGDGTKIAYSSIYDGSDWEIFMMNANGTGQSQITTNSFHDQEPFWSGNGSKIAFTSNPDGNYEIYTLDGNGTNRIKLTTNSANDSGPSWSPDNSKIAFNSNRDGNFEIYVMGADGLNPINITNNPAADEYPSWGPEAMITYYFDADGDGFGDPAQTKQAAYPPLSYVSNNNDCDDGNNQVYPNAPETCDGLDNDCDGQIDEGLTVAISDAKCTGSGNALAFDGTTARYLAATAAGSKNNFTIEFWAKPGKAIRGDMVQQASGVVGTSNQSFVTYGFRGGEDATACISVGTNGVAVLEHSVNYFPSLLVHYTPITDWTHIAIVYTNRQPALYINGVFVKTGLASAKANVYFDGSFAGSDIASCIYGGTLDEIKAWSLPVNGTVIRQWYNRNAAASHPNYSSLDFYYKLDETSGTTVLDAGLKGVNGTLSNNPLRVASTAPITCVDAFRLCDGGSATLKATVLPGGSYTYQWFKGDALIPNATQSSYTTSEVGTYKVTATGAAGCTATSTEAVVVLNAAVNTGSYGPLCGTGSAVTLNATPVGGTWSGAGITVTTNSSVFDPAVAGIGSHQLKYSYTDPQTGCVNSALTTIEVKDKPAALITASGPTSFCSGGSVTLTANEGASYQWSNGASTPSIVATTSGDYSVKVTYENGCEATSAVTKVSVTQGPSINVVTPLNPICSGEQTQLLASVSGTSSKVYLESYAGNTGWLVSPAGGSYSQMVCDCPSGYVAVGYLGRTGDWMDQLQLVCRQLLADGTLGAYAYSSAVGGGGGGGRGPYYFGDNTTALVGVNMTYSTGSGWMNSIQGYGKPVKDIVAKASNSSGVTYLSRMSGNHGHGGLGDVAAPPGHVITGMTTVNSPYVQRVSFRYSPISNVLRASEVVWSTGATGASVVVSPTTSTAYTATIRDINNCTATKEVTINVNEKPAITLLPEGPVTVCIGGSTLLRAVATLNNGTIKSYQWLKEGQPIGGATTDQLSVTQGGNYSVLVVTGNGCETLSRVLSVSAITLPSSVTITGSGTVCPNGSITLKAPAAPQGETYQYQWYRDGEVAGELINGAVSGDFIATTPGSYYVMVTKVTANGSCPVKSAAHVVTLSTPEAISIIGPEYVCVGSTTELVAPEAPQGKSYQYQWYTAGNGGTAIESATSRTHTTGQGGTYYVMVTDRTETSSCPVRSADHILSVGDVEKPIFTTAPKPGGDALYFERTTSAGCSYDINGSEFNTVAQDNCALNSLTFSLSEATTLPDAPGNTSLAGIKLNKGITTITWTAVDATGNKASHIFKVSVNDDDAPVLSCPKLPDGAAFFSRNTDAGACSYTVKANELRPSATDNCAGELTYYFKMNEGAYQPASEFSTLVLPKGSTLITWKAVDASGNTSSACSYTVAVVDTQAPLIRANTTYADGSSTTVNTDAGQCSVLAQDGRFDIEASDNCPEALAYSYRLTFDGVAASPVEAATLNGHHFRKGTTLVEWKVRDAAGNVSTYSFTIEVADNERPVFSSIPRPIGDAFVVGTNKGCTYVIDGKDFAVTATATDNCGVPGISYAVTGETHIELNEANTSLIGVALNQGINRVVWVAIDGSGNRTDGYFDVTVIDDDAPVPTVDVLPDVIAECSATVPAPTANDNCKGLVAATTTDPTTFDKQGAYNITWTYDDGNKNNTVQQQRVIIMDVTPPTITAPSNVRVNTDLGACEATAVPIGVPVTRDNCGGFTHRGVRSDGQPLDANYPKGVTTIAWTVTDIGGNKASAIQTVTVLDKEPPAFTAPAARTVSLDAQCSITVPDLVSDLNVSDNCSPVTVVQSPVAQAVLSSRHNQKHTITITATDEDGNATIKTVELTAMDAITPTITAPAAIVNHSVDPGTCYATVNLGVPQVGDNCRTIVTNNAPATFGVGTITVTWTVKDEAGNTATATQDVTVVNPAPVFTTLSAPIAPLAKGATITLKVAHDDNNVTGANITWNDGTFSNNVPIVSAADISHTYNDPGVYSIPVTLRDACGLETTSAFKYVVIFDPNGGFVTGGGWINSPLEPALPYMQVTGKAHFGFVSKFERGTTIPTGKTEFQFQAANLNFKSTVYEWLVIAGSRAQFKGSGTINGAGNYGFMLTGIDGDLGTPLSLDKFRIKIWDRSTDKIVYDNQYLADDDAPVITEIGGGSIVIHNPTKGKTTTTTARDVDPLQESPGKLEVAVMPNPSWAQFTLKTSSSSGEPLQVRVLDLLGRVVEVRNRIAPGTSVTFGSQYRPGVFFVEVIQGTQKATIKLIKQGE